MDELSAYLPSDFGDKQEDKNRDNQKLIFLITALSFVPIAQASSIQLAQNLGNLLASEEVCGLKYDPDAIAKFIEEKVPADDLSFATDLNTMTSGAEYNIGEMSASSKIAHCAQTKRAAKAHGFISE